MSPKPKVLLDVVPQESKLGTALEKEGAKVIYLPMITGDVRHIDSSKGVVGWEIKSTDDLRQSFTQGRLKEQLTRMLDTYIEPILCIWDWFMPDADGKIYSQKWHSKTAWDALWGALHFWQRRGIILDMAASRDHAAHRIVTLCKAHLRGKQ